MKYAGKDKVDGFGAQAWTAGVYFRDQAVNKVVKTGGNNALTRKGCFTAADGINGLHGRRDVRHDRLSASAPLLVLRPAPGEERQVHPDLPEEARHLRLQAVEPRTLKLDLITGT